MAAEQPQTFSIYKCNQSPSIRTSLSGAIVLHHPINNYNIIINTSVNHFQVYLSSIQEIAQRSIVLYEFRKKYWCNKVKCHRNLGYQFKALFVPSRAAQTQFQMYTMSCYLDPILYHCGFELSSS
jgi:hypothetical protein